MSPTGSGCNPATQINHRGQLTKPLSYFLHSSLSHSPTHCNQARLSPSPSQQLSHSYSTSQLIHTFSQLNLPPSHRARACMHACTHTHTRTHARAHTHMSTKLNWHAPSHTKVAFLSVYTAPSTHCSTKLASQSPSSQHTCLHRTKTCVFPRHGNNLQKKKKNCSLPTPQFPCPCPSQLTHT